MNKIKIIPEILITGGDGGSNGPISGLLGMELLNQVTARKAAAEGKSPQTFDVVEETPKKDK
jgi:hypothetical protein